MDLVGAAEIADMLGLSRQRVSQLAASADFPEPVAVLARGRVWLRDAVAEWGREHHYLHTDEP